MTAKELKPGTKMIIAGMMMEFAYWYKDDGKLHPAFYYFSKNENEYKADIISTYINKNYTKDTPIKDLK